MTTTLDRLLDGKISLRQSADGYRAGMDAVLLAASLSSNAGETLVEFGCGPGAALLCASTHLSNSSFIGVEVDEVAAQLASENIEQNKLQSRIAILNRDIADLEKGMNAHQVFFNPPYFDDLKSMRPPKPEKTRAWIAGDTPLIEWVEIAANALRPKGRLTLIHRADKLADIVMALDKRFGSVVVKPVQPHTNKPAKRVIVTARLGGRSPFVLLAPLVLHDDGPDAHTPEADAILRGRDFIEMEG
jgi:tRNA1(Val) A37 N6-methylase TrmN6